MGKNLAPDKENPSNEVPAGDAHADNGATDSAIDSELLAKILSNPEMAALLKTLAATIK